MSYPSMSAPLPPRGSERYPQLSSLLRTEDGFKKSISAISSTTLAIGLGILLVAILLLIRNLFSTISTLNDADLPWGRYFWDVFMSTASETSDNDPVLILMVWGPIIAVPVLAILIIVTLLTRNSTLLKLFHRYSSGGFVADLVATGVDLSVSNYRATLFTVATPSVPADWAVSAAQQIASSASQDKKRAAAWRKRLMGDGVAVPANSIDPSVPAGIVVTAVTEKPGYDGRPRVAIPHAKDPAKFKLYPLTGGAPLA